MGDMCLGTKSLCCQIVQDQFEELETSKHLRHYSIDSEGTLMDFVYIKRVISKFGGEKGA